MCGNASKKIAVLKQLQTHFNAEREKGVGTPFPRVPAPLHLCLLEPRFWFVVRLTVRSSQGSSSIDIVANKKLWYIKPGVHNLFASAGRITLFFMNYGRQCFQAFSIFFALLLYTERSMLPHVSLWPSFY